MSKESTIRVFHLDPCELVRHGLRALLGSCQGMVVAGEAATTEEALAKCQQDEYDLLLTELFFPDADGCTLLAEFKYQKPDLPIVVLTHRDGDQVTLMALRAGVNTVLTKGVGLEELTMAIRAASDGHSYMPSSIASTVIGALREQPEANSDSLELSPREKDVVRGLLDGMGNADLAKQANVSVSTVKTTLRQLFKKFGVSGRTELVATAMRKGLV